MSRPVSPVPQPGDDRVPQHDEKFLHSQRLETLGILAAQVAHDLNNVLVSILGDAALLADELAPGDPVRERVVAIAAAGRDARALVRQLVGLAGPSAPIGTTDLNVLVDEVLLMFRAVASPDVEVVWQAASEQRPVSVDAVQARQAILNLLLNAAAALDGPGTVRLETASTPGTELGAAPFVTRARPVRSRTYHSIAVADTGTGMRPEVLARAFEPFFSTRAEGTGLGLPAVLAAMTRHQGLVAAESVAGQGSVFTLYFPAAPTRPRRG